MESLGRRKARVEIFQKLKRNFCNQSLLDNPRTVEDILNQFENYSMRHMYLSQADRMGDIEYLDKILPRMQSLYENDSHFTVTDEGNIRISLPLLRDNGSGNLEKKKEIQYNKINGGMEKISILDCIQDGEKQLSKRVTYRYNQKGIEMERKAEKSEETGESSKEITVTKKRLENHPHIIKITTYEGKSQEDGLATYYDIRNGKHLENLDHKQGKRVEGQDIKGLTKQEQQQIIAKTNSIYRGGLENLMGIDIEQGNR